MKRWLAMILLGGILCSCQLDQGSKPIEIPTTTVQYMGVECVEVGEKSGSLMEIYKSMLVEGNIQHYTPVIIFINDNGDPLEDMKSFAEEEYGSLEQFTAHCLKDYQTIDCEAFFDERKKEYDDWSSVESDMEDIISSDDLQKEAKLYQPEKKAYIAKVPTDKPYEIFAYIPMGDWNDCPNNETHMAIAKKWYEKYGAIPCAIGYDTIQYYVDKPISNKDSNLAKEMFLFCPDIVWQGVGSLKNLEIVNSNAHFWFFWWD